MPFKRPSLQDIIERIGADIVSRFPGAATLLRRSNLGVLARVEAGIAHGLYGYADRIARQIIVDTADTDILERWGTLWGIPRKSSTPASGNVVFTGAEDTIVPAGLVLQRSDGVEFETVTATAIAGGTAVVQANARIGGESGNTAGGVPLALAAQVLGLSTDVLVDSDGLVGGSDVESDDSLRARILDRIRKPPQGGAAWDYEAWALECPGVTRAWVFPQWMGAGTVGVLFVRDDDASPIPDAGEVDVVQAYIDDRRPVTAEVFVVAPTALPIDITLSVSPDTDAVRAAVSAELADVFRRESEPGVTLRLSHLNEAVSLAAGEEDHAISVPSADIVATPGQMPVLGEITWA